MDDKFREFRRWPLRHKLASGCGTPVGSIIGLALLVVVWVVGWPVMFVLWIWQEYTDWKEKEEC